MARMEVHSARFRFPTRARDFPHMRIDSENSDSGGIDRFPAASLVRPAHSRLPTIATSTRRY